MVPRHREVHHRGGFVSLSAGRGRRHADARETTSFTDKTRIFVLFTHLVIGTGGALHRTDRFRLVDADTLLFEVTIDPASIKRSTCRVPQRGALSPTRLPRSRAGWFPVPAPTVSGRECCSSSRATGVLTVIALICSGPSRVLSVLDRQLSRGSWRPRRVRPAWCAQPILVRPVEPHPGLPRRGSSRCRGGRGEGAGVPGQRERRCPVNRFPS